MGIFSFLGKKDRQSDTSESDKDTSRRNPNTEAGRTSAPRPASPRTAARTAQQLDAARATAEKIDAIESEMTSEMGRSQRKKATEPGVAPAKATAVGRDTQPANSSATSSSILPNLGETTGFGLDTRAGNVVVESSETPPAIEEAAILFANEQNDMVEQMLLGAIHDASLGEKSQIVWRMLFDLYQITGKQEQFEHLSIEFAAKFETSPPAWDDQRHDQQSGTVQPTGATPAITFSGKLDSAIAKQLDRAQKLSEKNGVLRLEFARVTEVQADGCELLLATLKKLQKSGFELILVGAPDLATKIRTIIETGRRDDTDAPWLLLLEILQLLNREQEFEETSIDYCVTFEVSPPAFVAPKKVSTAIDVPEKIADHETEKFLMPAVVDGRSDAINTINVYVNRQDPAVIDCKNLMRIDFSAAGQLLSLLAPMAGKGKSIEFCNVNYLVAALFQVIGLRDVVHVTLRKH
ncbi:STAS domain-containing protein [Janthinobacterium sp. 17J80-10]|uniref:STAS domain-containing protein n=1 Tax=Janthinobacterium sp. 17J80-10 TaxID=2497863 RepID=UPI0010055427|nr:STAS domain-containing protein [Janthinobacterium sp. 17J80-10]QAU33287.1 STAS domain-containing protein [Janthinobacterium sp. 17J80-10]